MKIFSRRLVLVVLVVMLLSMPGIRLALNASYEQIDTDNCEQFPLPLYHEKFPKLAAQSPPAHYNRELAAHDYSFALVAAWGAYDFVLDETTDPKAKGVNEAAGEVTLPELDTAWKPIQGDAIDDPWWQAGLNYEVFVRKSADYHDYLVAYRGTEEPMRIRGVMDWIWGNFTYLTQFFPVANQYDRAARAHAAVQEYAMMNSEGRKVRFVSVGHSLGGGLARHVAGRFVCTSAVLVNSTPVENALFYHWAKHDNDVVHIFDPEDILSSNARKVFPEYDTANYRTYNQPVISNSNDFLQHSSLKMAVGVLRLVAECQYREELQPGDPSFKTCMPEESSEQKTTIARDLYCRTFGNRKHNNLWKEVDGFCPPRI